MSSPPSLLDLPNELLLAISEDLDEDNLLPLAATCGRTQIHPFGCEAAALLFRRPAIAFRRPEDPHTAPSHGERSRGIEVFHDALFAARSLNALITRLLHLGHRRFFPTSYVHPDTNAQLGNWLRTVAGLLNSAMERGDCVITVDGESGFRAGPRPLGHAIDEVRTRSAAVSPTRNKMPFVSSIVETRAAPSVQSITTFHIHTSLLFHATFFKWTIHTLNTAPITTLSLDGIDLWHYDWGLTLPLVTLLYAPVARRMLPRLAMLRGPPDYILYFLAGKAAKGAYSELRHVGVRSSDHTAYMEGQRALLTKFMKERMPIVEFD
ncbi:hypothetical protein B0H14DRAFT_3453794 [Mycena olivaceomarginata]|nr:hypothetical protein B0H14DRAFT_3453794 [Mycena olivaceomarginata]